MKSLKIILILSVMAVSVDVFAQGCLVAGYPLDGSAMDTSGNGSDGIVIGATPSADRNGNGSRAYLFDGIDDYIELNNNVPILTNSSEFTIAAWAKKKGPGGGSNVQNTLFCQRDDVLNTGVAIVFHAEVGAGKIRLSFRPLGGNAEQLEASSPLDTLYHHYAAVLDGDTAKIYLDGNIVGIQPYTQSGDFTTSVDYVDIGRNRIGGNNSGFFNGVIDGLQLYNCALTDAEIAALILPEDTCMPEAVYEFNGNILDSTGNGHNGSFTNATPHVDRNGDTNSAYLFDGTDDYIELNNSNPIITSETEFTITAWAKKSGSGGGSHSQNTLFSQRDDVLNTGVAIVFHAETGSGHIRLSLRPLGGSALQLDVPAPMDTQYHHYAAVLDIDTARIYLDGDEILAEPYTQSGDFTTSVDYVDIGRNRIGGANSGFFNGVIDGLQLYNCALSSEEIRDLVPIQDDSCLVEADYTFSGNAVDSSANGHDGTYVNATLIEDRNGKPDNAYLFDGSDDYIELDNNNPIITSETEFTVMAWAKMNGTGGGNNGQNTVFIQRDDALHTGAAIVFHADNGSGQIGLNIRPNGGFAEQLETTAPADSQYHHYAAVLDGDTVKIYLDGEVVLVEPYSQSGDFTTAVNHVEIGRNVLSGNNIGFFNGVIDEVQLFNCALTKTEIEEYAGNITGVDPDKEVKPNISIFPNPTSGIVKIQSLAINNSTIEVYSSTGRLVLTTAGVNEVDLSRLSSGLYYLSMRNSSGEAISQMVIKE